MSKTNKFIGFKVLGGLLVVIGAVGWLMNFGSSGNAEFITQQMYFALKEIANLVMILIGVSIFKIEVKE